MALIFTMLILFVLSKIDKILMNKLYFIFGGFDVLN